MTPSGFSGVDTASLVRRVGSRPEDGEYPAMPSLNATNSPAIGRTKIKAFAFTWPVTGLPFNETVAAHDTEPLPLCAKK